MTTDFRALITRMADELDGYRQMLLDDRTVTHRLSDEARAALADGPAVPEGMEPASVNGQPSDEELYDYWISTSPELGCADPVGYARAVLARWGRPQPAPKRPTVMQIIELADEIEAAGLGQVDLVRAALARWVQPAPQPVPVSERLPGPEDCDAEGLCWVWNFTAYTWGMFRLDLTAHSHWLPAHALPLP